MFLVNELGFLVVHARLSIFCETEIESECVVLCCVVLGERRC